jgi:hypothetical protein
VSYQRTNKGRVRQVARWLRKEFPTPKPVRVYFKRGIIDAGQSLRGVAIFHPSHTAVHVSTGENRIGADMTQALIHELDPRGAARHRQRRALRPL